MKQLVLFVGVAVVAALATDAQAQPTRPAPSATASPTRVVIPTAGISSEVRPDGTRVVRQVRVIRDDAVSPPIVDASAPPPPPADMRGGRVWRDGRWVEGDWNGGWDREGRVFEGEYRGTYVRDGRARYDSRRVYAEDPYGRVYDRREDGFGWRGDGRNGYDYGGEYGHEGWGYREIVTPGAPIVVEEIETTYETVAQPVAARARVATRARVAPARAQRAAPVRRSVRPRCVCR